MDSISQRYGFDVKIVIISMSNTYRNDNVVTMSQRYGFDVVTISIRCRIHMVTISRRHYRFDMDLISQQYGFDVEIVIISMSNPYGNDIAMALSFRYRFDIATIWIQCRIHMVTIMSLRCRNDMDSTSYRYRNDIESISK